MKQNMSHKMIKVGHDFSTDPYGRYTEKDGEFSGESFRENLLIPALYKYQKVIVDLDGTEGYGSSFLEEAFGGIIRHTDFSLKEIQERLEIVTNEDETWIADIWRYLADAENERIKK